MKILPHVGLGAIRLGNSQMQVISLLGDPSERRVESFSNGSQTEYFQYASPHITLGFSSDDGDRLGTITIEDDSARFQEHKVIGEGIESFLDRHPSFLFQDDFEGSGRDYMDKVLGLSIWVIDGHITNLTLFPDWIDDDTPKWPEQEAEQRLSTHQNPARRDSRIGRTILV